MQMDNEMTEEQMGEELLIWFDKQQIKEDERRKIEEEYKIKFIQEQGIAKWISYCCFIRKGTKLLTMFIIQKLIVEKKEYITPQEAIDTGIFSSIVTSTKYFKKMEGYGFLIGRKFGRKIKYFLTEDENVKKEIYRLIELIKEDEEKGRVFR
jgi:hypothetical protein